jgi:hypothetical protein
VTPRALLAGLGLVLALALALAGCGDSSSGAGGSPGPGSASTSSPSSVPTSASPSVKPATGRKVDMAAFTARTPKGYDFDNSLAKEIVFAGSPDFRSQITYSDVSVFPGSELRFLARLTIKNSDWHPKPRLAAPVRFAGARWYHLTGPIGRGRHLEDFGTVVTGPSAVPRLVRLSFELTGIPQERRRLVASVLATVRLK